VVKYLSSLSAPLMDIMIYKLFGKVSATESGNRYKL
jgi:hypothetical protein